MGDITRRAAEVLASADVVACEDTRRTVKLMNALGLKKPLISCHSHNERERAASLVDRAARGEIVALVSDAGTPGISDPGDVVIRMAIERGVDLDVLPGPVAFVPALLLSGLPARRSYFAGFLEDKRSAREAVLHETSSLRCTILFYISPHDVERDISDIIAAYGDRRAAISREITKVHQETIRGTLSEIIEVARARDLRGELVLAVEGAGDADIDDGWRDEAREMSRRGEFTKDIADIISEKYGVPKNAVKKYIAMGGDDEA